MYLWLIHVDIWQKPTQYYNPIIFQLKIKLKNILTLSFKVFIISWKFVVHSFKLHFFPQTTQYSGFLSLFLKNNFIYFLFGYAGLHCCSGFFSSCSKEGLISSCGVWASHSGGFSCCRAWTLGLSSCSSQALEHRSVVVVHGFSCSVACGFFPD